MSRNSRQSVVEDGGIIISAVIVSSNELVVTLCRRCSSDKASNGERGGDFLGEVHLEDCLKECGLNECGGKLYAVTVGEA